MGHTALSSCQSGVLLTWLSVKVSGWGWSGGTHLVIVLQRGANPVVHFFFLVLGFWGVLLHTAAAATAPVLCGGGFLVSQQLSSNAAGAINRQVASEGAGHGILHRCVDLQSFTAVGMEHVQGTLPEDLTTVASAVGISWRCLHVLPLSPSCALWRFEICCLVYRRNLLAFLRQW